MKKLLLIMILVPALSTQAASLVDLGYGSSSQTGITSFENDSVTVVYDDKTRLADLIPVTQSVKIIAHHNGDVEFDYPWYGFLASDKAVLESKVRSAVADALSTVPSAGWTDDDRQALAGSIMATLED